MWGAIIDIERISRLTEKQKQCLRLVGQLKTSKEIARDLGISPHTVDQRLKAAIRVLEVDGRAEAARLLAEHESTELAYQGLVYQRSDIAGNRPRAENGLQDDGVDAGPPVTPNAARKERSALGGAEGEAEPLRPGGHNDLNAWQRLAAILGIAIGSALSFGAILAGLDALSRLS